MKTKMVVCIELLSISASVIFFSGFAVACGFCKGDKAASVYSYENKKLAEERGANYLSAEIIGIKSEAEFKLALEALKTIDGVFPESISASFQQKAVSFVHEKDIDFFTINKMFAKKVPGTSLKKVPEVNEN